MPLTRFEKLGEVKTTLPLFNETISFRPAGGLPDEKMR
jgi:hypothetical protein